MENTESDLVSVIIPTYNRFEFLLNTIESIQSQTHKNIEIVVVNDCSTEPEYYSYNWENINIIHLEENSKTLYCHASPGYVRNQGILSAQGKYIAFCDDDDIWFPEKLELQINAMRETGCKMSCTDGYIGQGIYNANTNYKKYNGEHYFNELKEIYKRKGDHSLQYGFPKIWNFDFLKIHNCMICSSVIIEKNIVDKVGIMSTINYGEDYEYWKRALKHTDCVYVDEVCFYYNRNHGYGSNLTR
jgi:glycosyltransferase involved in cell wall biosynthesis